MVLQFSAAELEFVVSQRDALTLRGPGMVPDDILKVTCPLLSVVPVPPEAGVTPPGFVGTEKNTCVLCDGEPVESRILYERNESVGAPDP